MIGRIRAIWPGGGAPMGNARASQMELILGFLDQHDLAITPTSLLTAFGCTIGNDYRTVRSIDRRISAGEAVTDEWLEQESQGASRQTGSDVMESIASLLEENIERLSREARSARKATAEYSSVLEDSETRLGNGGMADNTAIAQLVRAMIGHARTLEGQMKRAEERSRSMRRDLDQARRMADEDHLTNLPNRRAFENHLNRIIAEADGSKPVCVGFCDIDHFKLVNDTHGHDTGDRVIRLVADHLSKATGRGCFVARHGGEEFALIFDDKTLHQAHELLDEARNRLSSRQLVDGKSDLPIGTVSFSGGLARCFPGRDIAVALRLADEALYQAKSQGRNLIVANES